MINSFVVQRILSTGFVFASSLLMAKILDPAVFGQVAFAMYLVKLFLTGQLGSESGFLFNSYVRQNNIPHFAFILFYSIQLLFIAVVVYFSSVFMGNVYAKSAVFFVLLIPFFTLNPILRVKKLYYATLLPDVLICFAVLAGVLFNKYCASFFSVTFNTIMWYSFGFLILSYPLLVFFIKKVGLVIGFRDIISRKTLKIYFDILCDGFPMYMGTLAYAILLAIDRFFLERYHNFSALGLYTLALQLSLGASLPISSQNFINVIDIGEKKREDAAMRGILLDNLKRAFIAGVIFYVILLVASFVLEKYFLIKYPGLCKVTAGLGLGVILFFISGSITPIAFYNREQKALTAFLFAIVLLTIIHNWIILLLRAPQIYAAYCTSFWLAVYSLFAIWYTYKKITL
ncbi:MAG: hypothetical protein M1561_01315 [Gammaproteobacteria bacterium]|nr:hypothetical protein [Gammaproteobacteria bacterium]